LRGHGEFSFCMNDCDKMRVSLFWITNP
jgi:hypothetical protein